MDSYFKGRRVVLIKAKRKIVLVILIIVLVLIVVIKSVVEHNRIQSELAKCERLYANKILKIPDKNKENIGFTCTGLFWDEKEKCFLIGNAGKYKPMEKAFKATIEKVNKNFSVIEESIECYQNFKEIRDIQGVSKDSNNTIWLCSYGENIVRRIDEKGKEISKFEIREPSGIAYDKRDDTLWILTNDYLYNCSYSGKINRSIKVHIKGQDQLFLDTEKDVLYFSAGLDYHGDSYIYIVDLSMKMIKPLYVLKDSYAIEGIAIVGNILYVLNDGYYHDAEIPYNQVNMYYLDDLQIVD